MARSPQHGPSQTHTTLPRPIAPFVGRKGEVEAIRAMLAAPGLRLLTLIGPGGVGKSRLALEVVAGLPTDRFSTIHFVPLAGVESPAAVPIAVANALDASDGGARPVIEGIRAALQDRPALLLLDNLEHVLPAASGFVSEILAACPSLCVLTTSRSPLRVYGELRFPVQPLATVATVPSDEGGLPEAVQLYLLRALAVAPNLPLSPTVCADIAELCRRLDGLPLAIELAAARAAELPPGTHLRRLERQFPLPAGGSLDMPERQQTMTAAVAWSYDLLDPLQQAVFRCVSVFSGEFDLDAAEALAALRPEDDTLEFLTSLAEASLLQVRLSTTGELRYLMLESIRRYGLAQAEAAGEADDLHQRHATNVAADVALADRHLLTGHRIGPWLHRLDERLSNIRAALAWSTTHDPALASHLSRHLMQYWLRRSRIQEGIDWLEPLRAVNGLTEQERGWLLANLARLRQQARGEDVDRLYADAMSIAQRHADAVLELTIRIGQAIHFAITNQPEDARAAIDAARAIPDVDRLLPRVTHPVFMATIDAMVVGMAGQPDQAAGMAEQALAQAAREGDDIAPALLHRILGFVWRERGNRTIARTHFLSALETYAGFGEEWHVASCLLDLATLFARDHPELSLRLAAGADTLMSIHGGQRLDPHREPYRSTTVALQDRLGADVVLAAWRDGASTPWRTILTEAAAAPVDEQAEPGIPALSPLPQRLGGALSPRELAVLRLIAGGQTDREIAATLGIGYRTVTTYSANILAKLDVPSRSAAVSRAVRDGILDS